MNQVKSCHVMSYSSLYGCLFWLAVCMQNVPKIMIPYRILSHNRRQQRAKRAAMQMVNLIEGCAGAGKGTKYVLQPPRITNCVIRHVHETFDSLLFASV